MTNDIWECSLEPFAENSAAAFILTETLFTLKAKSEVVLKAFLFVIQAIEEVLRKLYTYTTAPQATYNLSACC
jgi:hypothetical protein